MKPNQELEGRDHWVTLSTVKTNYNIKRVSVHIKLKIKKSKQVQIAKYIIKKYVHKFNLV